MRDLAYRNGDWFAVVLDDAVVVLPPTSDADTATRIYEEGMRDSSATGLVQTLGRMLGLFGPLPPFAVVAREPDGTRVLLRGPIELGTQGGTVSGRGAERWVEHLVPPGNELELSLDGTTSGQRLPIARGVVQCGWLGLGRKPLLHTPAHGARLAAEVPRPSAGARRAGAHATVPSPVAAAPIEPEPAAAEDDHRRPGDHDGLTLPAAAGDEARPVMEVSTGQRVELGPVTVVGRRPSAAAAGLEPGAAMVAVPSPEHDVSRNHVEVRVDGARVTVRDLGSTNGTRLRRGGGTTRLVAGQEHPLRNGDVAEIGDGIELRFLGLS